MSALDPLVILSAAPRMGTTLVQRLLCSSPDALIFGDVVGNEIVFAAAYVQAKRISFTGQGFGADGMLEKVLAGDTGQFIAPLMPPAGQFMQAMERSLLFPLALCRDEALGCGRRIWGWKLAGAPASFVRQLPGFLPEARVIRVERNLRDTVRSARAVGMVGEGADLENFIREVMGNRAALDGLRGRMALHEVDLDDFRDAAGEVIAGLEQFTGASAIRRDEAGVRVNSMGNYIAPAILTDEDEAIISKFERMEAHV